MAHHSLSDAALPISLIVPVHRGATAFARCLAAISRTSPPPAEVLVVCDGEAPEAARLARAQGCRVIEVPGPRGPAGARNAGARAALHPILFFVDSDVELPPTAVAHVGERFQHDLTLSALFGSYDSDPSEPSFLSQYRNLLHHFVHQTSSENASTFWGACGAIRREAFFEVSGFDERYLEPSIEDIELGYRLKRAGRWIQLDKTLQVKHLKRWDLSSIVRTDLLRRALPWGALILKHSELVRDLNLQRSSQGSVIAVATLFPSLLGAIWYPALLLVCLWLGLTLLALNRSFYRFLLQKRGLWFTAHAIPLHWLFYLSGGVGFGLAILRHLAPPRGRDPLARGSFLGPSWRPRSPL